MPNDKRLKLYNKLVEDGKYTKSFDDFELQFSNEVSRTNLYNSLSKDGLYTKSYDEFNNNYFQDIGQISSQKKNLNQNAGQQSETTTSLDLSKSGQQSSIASERRGVAMPTQRQVATQQLDVAGAETTPKTDGYIWAQPQEQKLPELQTAGFKSNEQALNEAMTENMKQGKAMLDGMVETRESKNLATGEAIVEHGKMGEVGDPLQGLLNIEKIGETLSQNGIYGTNAQVLQNNVREKYLARLSEDVISAYTKRTKELFPNISDDEARHRLYEVAIKRGIEQLPEQYQQIANINKQIEDIFAGLKGDEQLDPATLVQVQGLEKQRQSLMKSAELQQVYNPMTGEVITDKAIVDQYNQTVQDKLNDAKDKYPEPSMMKQAYLNAVAAYEGAKQEYERTKPEPIPFPARPEAQIERNRMLGVEKKEQLLWDLKAEVDATAMLGLVNGVDVTKGIKHYASTFYNAMMNGLGLPQQVATNAPRVMLDKAQQVYDRIGVEPPEKIAEALDRNFGEYITESAGGIVPVIINMAIANKALGLVGLTKWIDGISKTNKVLGSALKAVKEETLFQIVLDGPALVGTGFYGGSAAAGALLSKFNLGSPLFRGVMTAFGSGLGGVTGEITGEVLHSAWAEATGTDTFKALMNQYFGEYDDYTKRIAASFLVFSGLGVGNGIKNYKMYRQHLDFMKPEVLERTGKKFEENGDFVEAQTFYDRAKWIREQDAAIEKENITSEVRKKNIEAARRGDITLTEEQVQKKANAIYELRQQNLKNFNEGKETVSPAEIERISNDIVVEKKVEEAPKTEGEPAEQPKELTPAEKLRQQVEAKLAEITPTEVTTEDLLNKYVELDLDGKKVKGEFYETEDNTLVVETSNGVQYEVGKNGVLTNKNIKEISRITTEYLNEDGSISVGDNVYTNPVIEKKADGSYVVKTAEGKEIKGQTAENIAYEIAMRDLEKLTENEILELDAAITTNKDVLQIIEKNERRQQQIAKGKRKTKKPTKEGVTNTDGGFTKEEQAEYDKLIKQEEDLKAAEELVYESLAEPKSGVVEYVPKGQTEKRKYVIVENENGTYSITLDGKPIRNKIVRDAVIKDWKDGKGKRGDEAIQEAIKQLNELKAELGLAEKETAPEAESTKTETGQTAPETVVDVKPEGESVAPAKTEKLPIGGSKVMPERVIDINGYKFTDTPSFKDGVSVEQGVSVNALDNIVKNTGHWGKATSDVENYGNGWFKVGTTIDGNYEMYNTITNEAVTLKSKKGGRMGVIAYDFVNNNKRTLPTKIEVEKKNIEGQVPETKDPEQQADAKPTGEVSAQPTDAKQAAKDKITEIVKRTGGKKELVEGDRIKIRDEVKKILEGVAELSTLKFEEIYDAVKGALTSYKDRFKMTDADIESMANEIVEPYKLKTPEAKTEPIIEQEIVPPTEKEAPKSKTKIQKEIDKTVEGKPDKQKELIDTWAEFKRDLRERGKASREGERQAKRDIKDLQGRFKEWVKANEKRINSVNANLKASILRAAEFTTERGMEKAIDFVEKALQNKEYINDVNMANKARKFVKDRSKPKQGKNIFGDNYDTVEQMLQINPSDLTIKELADYNAYIEAAATAIKENGKAPDIKPIRKILDDFQHRINVPDENIRAIKRFDKLKSAMSALKNIDTIESVNDYKNLMRQVAQVEYHTERLLKDGLITEQEFANTIKELNDIYERSEKNELNQKAKEFKSGLIDEAKGKSVVLAEYSPQKEKAIRQFLRIPKDVLMDMSINDVDSYNRIIDMLNDGVVGSEMYALKTRADMVVTKKAMQETIEKNKNNSRFQKLMDKGYSGILKAIEIMKDYRQDIGLFGSTGNALYGNIYFPLADAMIKIDRTYAEVLKDFVPAYKKLRSKMSAGKFEDLNRKIGLLLSEKDWRSNRVSDKSGEYEWEDAPANLKHRYEYAVENNADKITVGKDVTSKNQKIWDELKKNYTKDGVLDVDAALNDLRSDKTVSQYLDGIENALVATGEYAQVATENRGKVWERRNNFFPTKVKEMKYKSTPALFENIDAAIGQMKGTRLSVEAGSTHKRTNKPYYIETDISKIMFNHVREVLTDYHLAPQMKSIFGGLTDAGKATGTSNFTEALKTDIMNRMRFELNKQEVDESEKVFRRIMRYSKYMALAKLDRPLKEMNANMHRAFLSEGVTTFEYAYATKKAYRDILRESVSDDLLSKYQEEIENPSKILEGRRQRFTKGIITVSDTQVGRLLFAKKFNQKFQELTGEKFDADKYEKDPNYVEQNAEAINKARIESMNRIEQLFNAKRPLSAPTKVSFFGKNMTKGKPVTDLIYYMQSFNQNELEQVKDSMFKIRSGNSREKAQGVRDITSIIASNYIYIQSGLLINAIAEGLLQNAFGDDDDNVRKALENYAEKNMTSEKKIMSLASSLVNLATGKNNNIAKAIATVSLEMIKGYGKETELLKNEGFKKNFDFIKEFAQKTWYASPPSDKRRPDAVLAAIIPAIGELYGTFTDMGYNVIKISTTAYSELKNETEKYIWDLANTVNTIISLLYPNPITPTIDKAINLKKSGDYKKSKEEEKQKETFGRKEFGRKEIERKQIERK